MTLARQIILRWLLPAVTGALLAFALPPFDYSELGWCALVPLLFALEGCERGEAFRRGYIAGLVFFGATVWWTIHVTLPGMVAFVAFLALYFGLGSMWFAVVLTKWGEGKDSAIRNILASVLGSAGWVVLEWVRGWFLYGGFGWNPLAVTQHQAVPLIQFAAVTGVYGVSALVCFTNCAVFFTIRRFARQMLDRQVVRRLSWEFYVAVLLVCGAFLHGYHQIRRDESPRSLRVALIQGNIPQSLKFDPTDKPMILERYRTLTERAVVLKPQLIIWPETATPEALRYDAESFALVTNLAAKADASLLTGTVDMTPNSSPPEAFNGAIMVRSDGSLGGIYHKMHLVPFGEFIPLRKLAVPILKLLGPKDYEASDDYGFTSGNQFTIFEVDGLQFGTVICFEDTLPELYRQFVQVGADFMVNITNDAWFKNSPASEMQLANAVFRAAETHRPLIRATNNGVTCIVDEFGFVDPGTRLDKFTDGSLVYEVKVPHVFGQTFFTRHSDWFVGVCLLGCAVGLVLLRRRNPRASEAASVEPVRP